MTSQTADPTHLARRVDELRQALRLLDPFALADRAGCNFTSPSPGAGMFHMPLWERMLAIPYPEFSISDEQTGQEAPMPVQALVLYYLNTCDGTEESGQWVSFAELPDGKFYNQAYQGYTGGELQRFFANDRALFEQAAAAAGGVPQALGDAGFAFQALPWVSLLAVMWEGDEDFPASFQVLFDRTAPHHLPTDVCAILGSMLTRKLISTGKSVIHE